MSHGLQVIMILFMGGLLTLGSAELIYFQWYQDREMERERQKNERLRP